jgi:hypothetical protein
VILGLQASCCAGWLGPERPHSQRGLHGNRQPPLIQAGILWHQARVGAPRLLGPWPDLQGNQYSRQPLCPASHEPCITEKGGQCSGLTSRAGRRRNFSPLPGFFFFLADNQADKNPDSLCLWESYQRICFIACTRPWRTRLAL